MRTLKIGQRRVISSIFSAMPTLHLELNVFNQLWGSNTLFDLQERIKLVTTKLQKKNIF